MTATMSMASLIALLSITSCIAKVLRSSSSATPAAFNAQLFATGFNRTDHPTREDPSQCLDTCVALDADVEGSIGFQLPRVLIIGDMVAAPGTGYFDDVREILFETAYVAHPFEKLDGTAHKHETDGICASSYGTLACISDWLGSEHMTWDIISFNWGLQDVSFGNGKVEEDDYGQNLKNLFLELRKKLKRSGQLVWQTTTPVSPSHTLRSNDEIIEMNRAQKELFAFSLHKPDYINDLHTDIVRGCQMDTETACFPTCECPQFINPGEATYTDRGNEYLAMLVAKGIEDALYHAAENNAAKATGGLNGDEGKGAQRSAAKGNQ